MRLGFHGGMCCGIKHIFELGTDPDSMCGPLKKKESLSDDVTYDYVCSDTNFFTDEAPEESKKDRLDRYLSFLSVRRPCGIVEITLITPRHSLSQKKWIPIITERGFKEVTPEDGIYNSNSGNRIRVFHLYMERK